LQLYSEKPTFEQAYIGNQAINRTGLICARKKVSAAMWKLGLIIIILLAGYILYLHILLAKKNVFIATLSLKLFGKDHRLSMKEINSLLNDLRYLNLDQLYRKDRFLNESIQRFILGDIKEAHVYIHYESKRDEASNIYTEGLTFAESFHRSVQELENDVLDLFFKHNNRKLRGELMLVIGISRATVAELRELIAARNLRNCSVEHILSKGNTDTSDAIDIFLLPGQFIKGYVDYFSGEIVANPAYNPAYKPDYAGDNLDRYTALEQL